jgi:cyclic-di-AMP phosphodiesterase PgpH
MPSNAGDWPNKAFRLEKTSGSQRKPGRSGLGGQPLGENGAARHLRRATGVLVLKPPGTAFAADPLKGALYGFIIAVTAVVMFQVSLQTTCRRNSRVILVLGGLVGHLILVRLVMGLVDAGHIPEVFRFFFVPFALAPMLHGVLLGRAVGAFSAVYVTLIGCLFVPQGESSVT